jgi:type II secretory pathway pseudopilin PulG
MIVVVIIGILAAMAIPRFMQSTTKTKQSEVKLVLKQIYVNQRTFRQQSTNNQYYQPAGVASAANPTEFSQIWVEIQAPARYSYSIVTAGGNFVCTGTGQIDDDPALDTWTIDDAGLLQCLVDDVTQVN